MKLTILDKSLLKKRLYLNFDNLSRKISEKISRTEKIMKFEWQNTTLTSGIIPIFLNATFVGKYIQRNHDFYIYYCIIVKDIDSSCPKYLDGQIMYFQQNISFD